jgi:hypothetical protein
MGDLVRVSTTFATKPIEASSQGGDVIPVDQFRTEHLQDADALPPNGGRKNGQSYVNNFFFFPRHLDGESILNG